MEPALEVGTSARRQKYVPLAERDFCIGPFRQKGRTIEVELNPNL